jgi:hypothetical protein
MIKTPTFGSDFELMVEEKASQEIIPVTGILGGTKKVPLPIGEDCFRQEDGPMAEFNIPPVTNQKDWVNKIFYCIDWFNNSFENYQLIAQSSQEYQKEDLDKFNLWEFGCDPSWNAYLQDQVTPDGSNTTLRTCGFHVHVGFEDPTFYIPEGFQLAKHCDLFLGIPSVLWDNDQRRRSLYGLPGDFRFKERGKVSIFEYRTLGGNLLRDKQTVKKVFRNLKLAIQSFNENKHLPHDHLLRETILAGNTNYAINLINQFNIPT